MKKDDFAEPSGHSFVRAEIKEIFVKARWGDHADRVGLFLATRMGVSLTSNATSLTPFETERLSRIAEINHVSPNHVPLNSLQHSLFLSYLRLCGCTDETSHFRVDHITPTTCGDGYPNDDWCRELKNEMEAAFPECSPLKNGCKDGDWIKFLFPNFTTNLTLWARSTGKESSNSWTMGKIPLIRLVEVLHRILDVDCEANLVRPVPETNGHPDAGDMYSVARDPRFGLLRRTDASWAAAGMVDWTLPIRQVDWNPPTSEFSVTALWVHIFVVGPDAVERYFRQLSSKGLECWTDLELSAELLYMRHAIEMWLMVREYHYSYVNLGGETLNRAASAILSSLESRVSANFETSPTLHRQVQWFAWCKIATRTDETAATDTDFRTRCVLCATATWARIRPLLEIAQAARRPESDESVTLYDQEIASHDGFPKQFRSDQGYFERPSYIDFIIPDCDDSLRRPWQAFEWEKDHLQTSLRILFHVGGTWAGLKAAILAWRASATPIVARDLRYWNEHGRVAPPEPWRVLVEWPIELFHHYIGDEQRADRSLEKLRGAFAEFLLKRLTDRLDSKERKERNFDLRPKTNDEMLERSPEWRFVCARAVANLGINPDGRGHRTLHQAQYDPDPVVREAAIDAYQRMRRYPGLPEGVSPRRAVLSALWWLRQGHLLALGVPLDRDGAQRTRIKELSRTREAEYAEGFEGP